MTHPISSAAGSCLRRKDLQENTPLMSLGSETRHGSVVSKKRCWMGVAFAVAALFYSMAKINNAFSARVEPFELHRHLSKRTIFIKPPKDIYNLPLNESCRVEYLDPSSMNLCWDQDNPCLDTFNCPRLAMPQLNPHATLSGFVAWYGEGSYNYISAEEVNICQREVFRNKVDYDISKQFDPIPGKPVPCEKEGRTYPISSEGCVVDGNHGIVACKKLKMRVNVIRFATKFLPLAEAAKRYIDLCWNRLLGAEICHLDSRPL